ncbi:hypothetical protein, partial [Microlunatus speluncae]|uniref:hypothetical protein n=1 Tax=Microlunatus speluncae TaxID=2594267 RepID=UPI001C2DCDB8
MSLVVVSRSLEVSRTDPLGACLGKRRAKDGPVEAFPGISGRVPVGLRSGSSSVTFPGSIVGQIHTVETTFVSRAELLAMVKLFPVGTRDRFI